MISVNVTLEWYAVSERLPESSAGVLIRSSHGRIGFGYYSFVHRKWCEGMNRGIPITHWTALPEIPNEVFDDES
jgi:hypothetical protein